MAFQRELHSKSDQLEDGEEQAAGGGPDHPGDAPPQDLALPQADSRKCSRTSRFSRVPVWSVTLAVTV